MTPFVARRSGTSQTPGENEKGSATSAPASLAPRTKSKFEPIPGEPMFDLIELLFFAYRDFVGDADRLLEKYDFGRAHHRVLHFVNRNPGLTIAELLDILRITKQSLNRVLKELVEQGYVEARAGTSDRRQRNLYPTSRGKALAQELAQTQSQRFVNALDEQPEAGRENAINFLLSMIDEKERDKVSSLIWGQAGSTVRKGS
ncbi:MAG: MarR family transcriptional regulator [Hyphomicrobiales bacterium]|nr:MarR family transcriptional regulator [Hyphomicrobiales bacterium]